MGSLTSFGSTNLPEEAQGFTANPYLAPLIGSGIAIQQLVHWRQRSLATEAQSTRRKSREFLILLCVLGVSVVHFALHGIAKLSSSQSSVESKNHRPSWGILVSVLAGWLALSVLIGPVEALVVQSIKQQTPIPQMIVDGGYQEGLLVGTLLEIVSYESLAATETTPVRQREVFVGKALVTEAEADWCLAEGIGMPLIPFAEGQSVRVKVENTVRYVTASQTNLLIDLDAATTQIVQKGNVLQVLRRMEFSHPITQEPVHMLDPIGTVQIIHTTPHRFTARAVSVGTVKPILPLDVVRPIEQPEMSVHVLRILTGGAYLNRYDGAVAGQQATFTRATSPSDTPVEFRVRAIYKHLVEIESSQVDDLEPGESVTVEIQTEE